MAAVAADRLVYDNCTGTTSDRGVVKKVHFAQDYKESPVDIYVSTESLRVYNSPWVEEASPASTGPPGAQHTESFVGEKSRRSHSRCDSKLLGILCLLLLIGIICIAVKMNIEKDNQGRDQKRCNCTELRKKFLELKEINAELRKQNRGESGKKCKNPKRGK